jgi:hypothetical protein
MKTDGTKRRGVQWSKLASDFYSNRKIRRAGRNGRDVFLFVLCRNAGTGLSGSISVDDLDVTYLADILMITQDDAKEGIDRAVEAKLIRIDEEEVIICGWDDQWSKGSLTEAEGRRMRRQKKSGEDLSAEEPTRAERSVAQLRAVQRRPAEDRTPPDIDRTLSGRFPQGDEQGDERRVHPALMAYWILQSQVAYSVRYNRDVADGVAEEIAGELLPGEMWSPPRLEQDIEDWDNDEDFRDAILNELERHSYCGEGWRDSIQPVMDDVIKRFGGPPVSVAFLHGPELVG